MANLTRFDPLSFDEPFENFVRNFFWKPVALEASKSMQIKLDVKEDDKNYTVRADLPGVEKEDIKVSVDGNQVTISAETKKESEEKKDGDYVHRERYYGSAYRSFTLAQAVDEAGAQASYRDGVLELVLPKRSNGQTKQLTIQ
ncbi:hypothetical protein ABW99_07125 [Pandoraea thiooxydans]|uniref:SHSP domain-containing protein n=1 Tax=Pandoraea thiooxydans TaxID=445709 RepID=A0A0G3F0C4_9BURK|nr:Hsp20/alpha crystallin family protein [Pandoraea thiooxydans]AKJ70431.1 hypothetical protein ABW99_07125 [Pandoraea thiooxydans]